jgi:hypothetical protein
MHRPGSLIGTTAMQAENFQEDIEHSEHLISLYASKFVHYISMFIKREHD